MRLLKIEWLKLKRYPAFWLFWALFATGVVGLSYFVYRLPALLQAFGIDSTFEFPTVWYTVSYLSHFILPLLGMLMIMNITNEFTYRTHRQNIIDGLSRREFIHVKMLLCVVFAVACTLLVGMLTLLFGLSGKVALNFDEIRYLGYFFIQALSYISLGLLFGQLIKRPVIAIAVYLMYAYFFEVLLVFILNKYIKMGAGHFLPLEPACRLIPLEKHAPVFSVETYLLAAIGYLMVYYIISRFRFGRENL